MSIIMKKKDVIMTKHEIDMKSQNYETKNLIDTVIIMTFKK